MVLDDRQVTILALAIRNLQKDFHDGQIIQAPCEEDGELTDVSDTELSRLLVEIDDRAVITAKKESLNNVKGFLDIMKTTVKTKVEGVLKKRKESASGKSGGD